MSDGVAADLSAECAVAELPTFPLAAEQAPVNAYPQPAEPAPYELDAASFNALAVAPAQLERRQRIHTLQAALVREVPGSEVGPDLLHLVSDGVYFRQIVIPAGLVVVSKRHAREHICTISQGSATVFTEDGVTLIQAPYSFVSPAGSKRVLLVHEEITWATVHRTKFTKIEDIEKDIIMDETLLLGVGS